MPQLGPLEIAVVLLIALLVFGPNRLPELAKQVGGALRELKKIQQNIRADLHDMMRDESDGAAPPPTLPPLEAGDAPGNNGSGSVPNPINAPPPSSPASSPSEAEAD
jgi:sec-independent protein translocase protein TatA